ncbi:unnamed protein product [Sympodiomycopsis kandeliae]
MSQERQPGNAHTRRKAGWKHKRQEQHKTTAKLQDGAHEEDFWHRMATSLPQTAYRQAGQSNETESESREEKRSSSREEKSLESVDTVAIQSDAHASDHEGISDLEESEKAAYLDQKRLERKRKRAAHDLQDEKTDYRARLDEMQRKRVQALEAAAAESRSQKVVESTTPLTENTFKLMLRTSQAIRSSPNAVQLEAKIFANHGNDPRFAFLRGNDNDNDNSAIDARAIWLRLKAGQDISWKVVQNLINGHEHAVDDEPLEGQKQALLSGYDSSDSESETEGQNAQSDQDELAVLDDTTPDKGRTEPPSDRIARAREWAAARRSMAPDNTLAAGKSDEADIRRSLTGKDQFAIEQAERIRKFAEQSKKQAQDKAASMKIGELRNEAIMRSQRHEKEEPFSLEDDHDDGEQHHQVDTKWASSDEIVRIG